MTNFIKAKRFQLAVLLLVFSLVLAQLSLQAWTPQAFAATTYEAESAALSGGAVFANDHAGYSGSGFAAGFIDVNKGNAAAQFTVSASTAGSFDLTLRYSNGTGSSKTLSLYVNGAKLKQITLPATANWDSWSTRVDTVSLIAGSNTIRYKFDTTDSGNVNLDKIDVAATPAPPAGQYEAESAALSGGAVAASDHAGYTGSGFAAGFIDSNKGNALAQFTVNVSGSGNSDVILRYANGTGSAKTLSIYVNGTKIGQTTLQPTANWDTWGTQTETLSLNSGNNTIGYKFDTTDSGNVNLDNITVSAPVTDPGTGFVYQAEDQFFSGSVTVNGSYLQNFTSVGARVIFTVNTEAASSYNANLRYANGTGGSRTLNVYVNGLYALTATLSSTGGATTWATKTEALNLRKGLNTISFQYDSGNTGSVNIDYLSVDGGVALAARGATLPYQEYEAENGTTNASVLAASRTFMTVESESSGRRAVRLSSTGHYVQWTTSQTANAIVLRYSMPDSPSGGGTTGTLSLYVNGAKAATLNLSSKYAWTYGAYPYNDNPANGNAHHFYDESRFLVANIPAGATVKLQKDAGDTAASYVIDLIDLEQVDAAYVKPANFLDVTQSPYNAVGNGTGDQTTAIQNAINDAKAQGKGVWIPSGTFRIAGRLNVDNVQVRGAGVWYTKLLGAGGKGGFWGQGNNITIADMAIESDSLYRNDAADNPGFEGNFGTGSLIQNVWIEHMKVGFWISPGTNGLYIVNGKVRDTWADGVNFSGGVLNSTMSHFNIRNTGDDAFAMWSNGNANVNDTFRYNTAQLPCLANTFAVYGGQDNKIFDNVGSDTVTASAGIVVSNRFGATAFTGTTQVRRNTLNRTGGWEPNWNTSFGGLWIYAENAAIAAPVVVDTLVINDSTYDGIKLSYNQNISNTSFSNVQINGAGGYGLYFDGVTGTGTFTNVTVTGAASGGLWNSTYTINRGTGNSGW